jgi:hypothetical protein
LVKAKLVGGTRLTLLVLTIGLVLLISTLGAGGQNLTRYFALSVDDVVWRLSPDGTKVAAYREVYDEATGESPVLLLVGGFPDGPLHLCRRPRP